MQFTNQSMAITNQYSIVQSMNSNEVVGSGSGSGTDIFMHPDDIIIDSASTSSIAVESQSIHVHQYVHVTHDHLIPPHPDQPLQSLEEIHLPPDQSSSNASMDMSSSFVPSPVDGMISTTAANTFHSFSSSSSILQRWLRTDIDSAACCVLLLQIKDIAALHACCKSWKKYLDKPPRHLLSNSSHRIMVRGLLPSAFESLSLLVSQRRTSDSLRQYVKAFVKWRDPTAHDDQGSVHKLLMTVTYFTSVTKLFLEVDFLLMVAADMQSVFQALQHSLVCLLLRNTESSCNTPRNEHDPGRTDLDVCADLFDAMGKYSAHQLKSILIRFVDRKIIGNHEVRKCQLLPFAFLKHLPQLTSFTWDVGSCIPFSHQQMLDIIRCKQLKALYGGHFVGQHHSSRDQDRSRQRWIDEGIALLRHLPALESGDFWIDRFSDDCVPHLVRISSIANVFVRPLCDYSFMLQLPHLRSVSYWGTQPKLDLNESTVEHRCVALFIRAVTQIPTVTELDISNATILPDEWMPLFQKDRLDSIFLSNVRLDPSKTFALDAQTLHTLSLRACSDLSGNFIGWHKHLPILTKLCELHILDGPADSEVGYSYAMQEMELKNRMPATNVLWRSGS